MTFKYRLKPTKAQQRQLEQTLELCRWVYNETLATRKNAYEQDGTSLSYYDSKRLLPVWKADKPELKQAHSQVLQDVVMRVDLAFQAFFRRVKAGETPGYPRFRGAGWYDSFTYPQYGNGVRLEGDRLTLSKIGAVRVKLHRPVMGAIKTVTIRRDSVGNWYVCLSCEVEAQPLPVSAERVGVDLGLKTFAVLSTGDRLPRQRWMKQDAADMARLQRKKEKYPKGSPERRNVIRALHHAYQRATNRRANFAHRESRQLVNRFGLIAFEDLDIAEMQSNGNHIVNRGMADVAWGQFVQFTTYKAESAGRAVLLVNPRGTTQECSGCGQVVPKDLSVRVHDCPHCGLKLDRDLNAALNILARGLASIGADSSVTRRSPSLEARE
jgi:putative transposase